MTDAAAGRDTRALVVSKWPRLYLDTAEILRIADGKEHAELVSALTEEMRQRGVLLLVSIHHLEDALPKAVDPRTVDRVADALERFAFRAVVTKDPAEVEPWPGPTGDIEISPASNIRELLNAPAAAPVLHDLSAGNELIHETNNQFRDAQVSYSPASLERRAYELYIRGLCAIVLAETGADLDSILISCEASSGVRLTDDRRTVVRALLVPAFNLMAEASVRYGPTREQRRHILSQMGVSFDDESYRHSPGMFLAARVARCRIQNVTRVPQPSDSLDGQHASFFPYVDIATCDRQTYACVCTHLAKVSTPRRVQLVRNGRLAEVLAAVQQLPALPPLE